jgi:hypothetical protein
VTTTAPPLRSFDYAAFRVWPRVDESMFFCPTELLDVKDEQTKRSDFNYKAIELDSKSVKM